MLTRRARFVEMAKQKKKTQAEAAREARRSKEPLEVIDENESETEDEPASKRLNVSSH